MRLNLLAALLMALPFAPMADAADAPRQIVVTGSAEIEAVPDLATISAGVQTQAETAGQALADNSAAMTAVFKVLEGAGVARADLQTSQLSLDPVWEQSQDGQMNPTKVVAYQANNMLTIKVRAVSNLGAVIDALGGAGANRIFGIGFEVDDPRPLLDTARTQAVTDARAKARLIAKAAGVTLGPVLSIRESPGVGTPGPLRAKADMEMAAPVAEGSVTLGAEVEVVFGIE